MKKNDQRAFRPASPSLGNINIVVRDCYLVGYFRRTNISGISMSPYMSFRPILKTEKIAPLKLQERKCVVVRPMSKKADNEIDLFRLFLFFFLFSLILWGLI